MLSQRQTLLIGILLGGLAVAIGAFGAHAFKNLLVQNNRVETYELAVRYHFFHALTLILISQLMDKFPTNILKISATCFVTGTLLFSGSLYVMAISNATTLALITPIGGGFFLIGWGLLFYSVWKSDHTKS